MSYQPTDTDDTVVQLWSPNQSSQSPIPTEYYDLAADRPASSVSIGVGDTTTFGNLEFSAFSQDQRPASVQYSDRPNTQNGTSFHY